MNFRDRIAGEEEERGTITFTLKEGSADADVSCNWRELVQFLASILSIASEMMQSAEFSEELEQKIIKQWKKSIRDLTTKKKKWVY